MGKYLFAFTSALLLAVFAPCAFGQTKPDQMLCKQRGGLLDCRDPNIGSFAFSFQRCDVEHPATDDGDATTRGAAYYYSAACGGDQQIVRDGPWPTPSSVGNPVCGGGSAVYPKTFLGYETENGKAVIVHYCYAINGGNEDGFAVWRRRPVTCPDGFAPQNTVGDKNYGLCISTMPAKCLSCCSDEGNCGNPVNVGTLNKIESTSDLRLSDTPLGFTRNYNARIDVYTGRLGKKWRHSFERSLDVSSASTSGVVVGIRDDGRRFTFWRAGTGWTADPDIIDRLTATVDGSGNPTGWTYYVGSNDSVEQYDATGKLLSLALRTGVGVTLQYSDASTPMSVAPGTGFLILVTDTFGRSMGLAYDTAGRITLVTGPDNGQYVYGYDSNTNDLVSVTFPDGKTRQYIYNEPSRITNGTSLPSYLTGIIDENNQRFANFQYYFDGRSTLTEHAGGVDRYTFTSSTSGGGATNIANALGGVQSLSLTSVLDVTKINQHDEPCPTCLYGTNIRYGFNYDTNGNVSLRSRGNGNYTTYAYDLTRNLEVRRVEGNRSASFTAYVGRTISTTWHPTFRLPATISEQTAVGNKVTTFTYDNNGNLLSKSVTAAGQTRAWSWTYDNLGRVLTATDPRSNSSVNTYYANDASQGTRRGMLRTVTNAANHTTTVTDYNANGQPLAMTDPNGLVTSMTYDARQRLTARTVGGETTIYEYDAVGQLIKVTLPDNSYLVYAYDAAHRLYEITDSLGNKVTYTLDDMGNRTAEAYKDPLGALARIRSRVYDALNRLQQDIGGATPATQLTQYRYDLNGNLRIVTDPLNRTTTQRDDAFDALDRMINVTDSLGGVTYYDYDFQDNLTKVTDPKNLATSYTYNGFNELLTQSSPDTGGTSFTYDAAGNLATKTDARGVIATYAYDALNRVSSISYPAYQSDPAETVVYTYDSCGNGKGRLCSIADKTGTTAYTYDIRGRILAKAQTAAGLTQTVSYGYNAAGQMDRMTLPSGKVVTYAYVNNRVTGITYDGQPIVKNADYEPFGPVGEWTWGNDSVASPNKHTRYFDLDGRNTKIESGSGIDPAVIVYDAASRITDLQKLTASVVDPVKSTTYGYDSLDRLTGVTPNAGNPNPARGFSYDGVGNRLSSTIAGSTSNYGYGTSSHRLNSLSGAITKSFSYDADGNRTADGTSTWSYGANNRPFSIAIPGGTPVTLQAGINALGQRVTKTVNGTVTRFIYDEGGRLIGEYDVAGRALQETLWFNDLPVAVIK